MLGRQLVGKTEDNINKHIRVVWPQFKQFFAVYSAKDKSGEGK
jgi:hypothetical protein